MSKDTEVAIIGAGPAGLVLALSLHQVGIECRVYEAAQDIRPLGVGVNLLPHAVRELDDLGLLGILDQKAVRTLEESFFTHLGQHVLTTPAGEAAGYPWPQYSMHRGDLQLTLLGVVRERLGADSVVTGRRCVGVEDDGDGVIVRFEDVDGEPVPDVRASVVVGCDGIHSAIRRQLHPGEGEPVYSGLTSFRGAAPFPAYLSGGTVARVGWMDVGKLIVYPIRPASGAEALPLVNFVVTLERPHPNSYDWDKLANLEDFLPPLARWHFDWLDVPELLKAADPVMVFPMVDREPLPSWTRGRVTLMGDAAHPMIPRGSNGAGQAILDARCLAGVVKRLGVTPAALEEYEGIRREATSRIVLTNRTSPPDAVLRAVYERNGGAPFDTIEDVIPVSELTAIIDNYRKIAGFDLEQLLQKPAYV